MTAIERAARTLLVFSLLALVGVIAFGTLRASPAHRLLDTPEAARSLSVFHSHFDQLCWLGAAATGAVLHLLRRSYAGPAWAPRLLAASYVAGTLLFSFSFAVRGLGERLGSRALAKPIFAAMVSVGGLFLVAMATAVAVVAASIVRAPAGQLLEGGDR